jgi:hypothetical protein
VSLRKYLQSPVGKKPVLSGLGRRRAIDVEIEWQDIEPGREAVSKDIQARLSSWEVCERLSNSS